MSGKTQLSEASSDEMSSFGSNSYIIPGRQGHLDKMAAAMRAKGLQSPWRMKSDELINRFDLLAEQLPNLDRDESSVDDEASQRRTHQALMRFDRLTQEINERPKKIDFNRPEFHGPYKYEDVKKLCHVLKQLGLENDGTFNYNKLLSIPEWSNHPLRFVIAALNLEQGVDAWVANIEYMEAQLSGNARANSSKKVKKKSGKRKRFGQYTLKEVLELKMLFDSMDEDGSGEVDMQEFLTSPAWQNSHLCATASTVFNTIDADGDGKISLVELLAITFPGAKPSERKAMKEYLDVVSISKPVVKTRERRLDALEIEEIEEMFSVFDLDGNGTVSVDELVDTLKMMGSYGAEFLSETDLKAITEKYDTDGDKDLNLEEFKELMKSHYLNTDHGF